MTVGSADFPSCGRCIEGAIQAYLEIRKHLSSYSYPDKRLELLIPGKLA